MMSHIGHIKFFCLFISLSTAYNSKLGPLLDHMAICLPHYFIIYFLILLSVGNLTYNCAFTQSCPHYPQEVVHKTTVFVHNLE